MALHLHRAERTDLLADGLGALLADPLPDPFADELVIVPAKGVERWLSQRLSHILGRGTGQDGVCAGISFRNPRSLIAEITGTDDDDPWHPDTLVWPLLDVIDGSCDDDWCKTLATHLGHFEAGEERELRMGRRYAVARRLAGLFASYARQRPQLLIDWENDAAGGARRRPRLAAAPVAGAAEPRRRRPAAHPARENACHTAGVAHRPARADLAVRPHPAAQHRDRTARRAVHPPRPSPVAAAPQRQPVAVARRRPRPDPPPRRHQPPRGRASAAGHPRPRPSRAAAQPAAGPADRRIPPGRRPTIAPTRCWAGCSPTSPPTRCDPTAGRCSADDRSVQVHSCHGPARQIDVLREVLLGLLADDETLEPRDILVMCPDIETYAPLIVAGFGLGDMIKGVHPAHKLRVRLADRSLVQTNPLLGVASQLLALASGRATSSEVLNLAQAAPVRARFGFTDDNLEDITRWVRQANIRWGFDRDTASRTASTSSRTHGVSASTACSRAWRCPTTRTPGSRPPCRSTTSAATASSSRASWPSTSTGCSMSSNRSPG